MLSRLVGAPLLFFAAVACADSPSTEGPAEWPVAVEPRLSVGDRADSDTALFARVTDAWLLPGGLLAVADGGASAVLSIDSVGALVSRVGRKGRGPGEFLGAITLMFAGDDSAAVWDPSTVRWTVVDARSGGARTATDSSRRPTLLHAGILVRSPYGAIAQWVPPLLNALSVASPEVRLAQVDALGALWVSQDAAASRWRVYVDSGAPVAAVTLPEGLDALQFTASEIVGVRSDSLGLQHVVVHGFDRGAHAAPEITPATVPAVTAEARGGLMSALSQVVMAQEMYWMRAQRYTPFADSLTVRFPPEARFKVLTATERGWLGVAWYPANGFTCGMVVGLAVPAGWQEAVVACGW